MTLICDDCGSVNSPNRDACELCGGSLSEERERAARGSSLKLLLAAVVVTVVFCVVPGVLIESAIVRDVSAQEFALGYLGVWVVGSVLAHLYRPKDDYDFGWGVRGSFSSMNYGFLMGRNRGHFSLGVILFPFGIVSGLWIAVFQRLFR